MKIRIVDLRLLEALHPQDAAEVLIDFSGTLALGAPCEELSNVWMLITSQHQLIRSAATAGAGLATYVSANSPDFPLLFLHLDISPGNPGYRMFLSASCGIAPRFENTEEVGGTSLKGGVPNG